MVKFSFIVPIYNIKKDYLEQCLNSLINQTFEDFEILLIDDGSTNGAEKWCDTYEKENSQFIRTFHKKNEGVSTARNKGIQESRGVYLIFVDPDDWVDVNTCEKINMILDQCDFDILTYFYYTEFTDSSIVGKGLDDGILHKLTCEEKGELILQLIDTEKKLEYKHFRSTIFGAVWGKCFKRAFLFDNNILFKKELIKAQDTIFNLDAFYDAKDIVEYRYPLYHYRMVKTSITHHYNPNMAEIQLLFLESVKKFIEKNGLSGLYQEAFINRCISSYFSTINLDIFHCENRSTNSESKDRWKLFVNTEYIRNISPLSLNNYSWRIKIFLIMARMQFYYGSKLFYNFRNKIKKINVQDNLFE